MEFKYLTFNKTALICAAYKGHKEIVELLLNQEEIDINSKDILNAKKKIHKIQL